MSGQYSQGPSKTFTASGPLNIYSRVLLDSNGELAYAGAADTNCIGITMRPAFAEGDRIAVWLLSAQGTFPVTAAGPFAANVGLYAAANGQVAATGTVLHGLALEAANEAGDQIESLISTAAILGTIARSALTQDVLAPFPVSLTALREKTAIGTLLPTAAATTDMGLIDNTYQTAAPTAETIDQKTANASAYCRFQFAVPMTYVAGQAAAIKINAGMKTTVADTTAILGITCVRQAAPTVDIGPGVAQSINSLTAADKTFNLTPTALVPGDVLDVLVTVAIHDAASATAVIGKLNSITMLLDVQG
jgi:hypothetical protein